MVARDEILERLAAAHRGVMSAGQSRLDQDHARLLDEIDKAIEQLVAVAELVRDQREQP
jgi:hypothetical protein